MKEIYHIEQQMLATMKSTRKKPRQLTLYVNNLAHFTSKKDVTTFTNARPEIQFFFISVINKDNLKSLHKEVQGLTVQDCERGKTPDHDTPKRSRH